ncbi:hypothetical protein ACOMHN_036981 [Nucella lapillus]
MNTHITEGRQVFRNYTSSTSWTDTNQHHEASTNTTDATSYPEYQAAMLLWAIWPPCILLLGGFGNIATICVMRRIRDHNSSQHVILMSLAVSDFFFLYVGALRVWLKYYILVDIYGWHPAVCKLYAWVIYSSNATSAWLLTCVTVQRTMAVKWPHKIKMVCTVRRTWIAVAAVVISVCTLQSHWLVGMEFSGGWCIFMSADYLQFVLLWSWVDTCLSSLLPSICLLVCDIFLSLALFQASSDTSVTVASNSGTNLRRKTASRTTIMILVVSCTFLVLTLPVCVYIIWLDFVELGQSPRLNAKSQLAKAVTFLLWYTNSAVNFLLYCFTGTKFRKEFFSWLSCQARSQPATSVNEKNSDVMKK